MTDKLYHVYALSSLKENYICVGLTDNPERRIQQHNAGKGKTTRSRRPFKTILIEKVGTRVQARARKKYLKSGIGKEYLKTL